LSNRILFLKFGGFSNINNNVYKTLEHEYPDYKVEILDALYILKHKIPKYIYLVNLYFFLKEYAFEIITGEKKMREYLNWYFATSYISSQISKKIQKICAGKTYTFTFQTQSLYNGKIKDIPNFVYTDHTTKTNLLYPNINPHRYMRSKRFIEKCEIKTYQDATMIFTFGSLSAYSLVTQYQISKEKVLAIYSGSNANSEIKVSSEKCFTKNILFVGVEWERKGGPILLKVFEKVLSKHPDASLTIVGCHPQNITLPNCTIAGKIPIDQVSDYYNQANIFCLPTMREPFGVAFIEAMNFRLPIVANNIGCIPDFVKNDFNGFLIDNNIDDYTDAICLLLDNPEKCRQMGENGYERARSKFTWDIVGRLIKENIDNKIVT
jgi:glycosyltransferase involved in cell wall biosynthesis